MHSPHDDKAKEVRGTRGEEKRERGCLESLPGLFVRPRHAAVNETQEDRERQKKGIRK
jgi:hypothetical protein